ncbi:MAG: MGMT family protein [Bacteroidaceae bacterium]|nr:MGMT family protein [Bacteroidaceae bacterium]
MGSHNIRQRILDCASITEFQRKVYLALLDVPSGKTVTYGELARLVGCRSAQAVGQALRRNPFAPDVPCHRVVAKHGIGGFLGQSEGDMVDRKRKMLEDEDALPKD